jgi:hypothetical protein
MDSTETFKLRGLQLMCPNQFQSFVWIQRIFHDQEILRQR